MRSLLDDNRGQIMGLGFIFGIVLLVMDVLLITAFWPTIQDSFDVLRDQDNLNCKSTTDICGGVGSQDVCYNSTKGNSQTTTCAMVSIGPPLIFIVLLLGAIMLIMKGGTQPQQQFQQPYYQ
jgi:hypothetical protein